MSGKKSRDKGLRREREWAKKVQGERVPLSGAAGGSYTGDVIDKMGIKWECKSKKDGWKQLYSWLEGNDALALKADNNEWLVVMPANDFLAILEILEEAYLRYERHQTCGYLATFKEYLTQHESNEDPD